ncbi:hypothetical protein C8Z91_35660 [Paenibacillus elgii]|uniref:Multi-TM2 domain-containing protein n=1 Tax=Paenibacillus elgii TaxID=189691 RepID=A0A2T6FRN1_9BACL|nr:hypothetical protein [Paenibacillus elgii]PUA34570.1 hypothetical protein C8Z91_35660 [Paenibacillus elgii]
MNTYKSPVAAFLLSFIPGLGHLYMGRVFRGLVYGFAFFGLALLTFFVATHSRGNDAFYILLVALAIAVINVFDMVFFLLTRGGRPPAYRQSHIAQDQPYGPADGSYRSWSHEASAPMNDRFRTIVLSFVPGLGHLHLGLMQRGLGFMVLFFGLTVMIFFLSVITHRDVFLVFLGALPVIWLYCMFDCVQQYGRKERGEVLTDRTIFEEFQESRESGKKNKTLATLLSIFPGAGHMYLGLQKRGLQLMAAFLFCIYIMDVMRLSLFMFLIPILWFFSFFDALQMVSKVGREELRDVPVVGWLLHHQRWLGYGLLALGAYYLLDRVLLSTLDIWLSEKLQRQVMLWFNQYFQTFVISVLLIGGGIRLLRGNKKGRGGRS